MPCRHHACCPSQAQRGLAVSDGPAISQSSGSQCLLMNAVVLLICGTHVRGHRALICLPQIGRRQHAAQALCRRQCWLHDDSREHQTSTAQHPKNATCYDPQPASTSSELQAWCRPGAWCPHHMLVILSPVADRPQGASPSGLFLTGEEFTGMLCRRQAAQPASLETLQACQCCSCQHWRCR